MIEVSPAILTSDTQEFLRQFNIYQQFARQVDIDINIANDNFGGQETVNPFNVLESLIGARPVLGMHLMVSQPASFVEELSRQLANQRVIFYVHQEADWQSARNVRLSKGHNLAMVVKAETELWEPAKYNDFPEVQLMTIETGKQGNPFKPETLERIDYLRQHGFLGKVSIDGGVGLENVSIIKQHMPDRVSVGSYLAKAEDPFATWQQLTDLLNT